MSGKHGQGVSLFKRSAFVAALAIGLTTVVSPSSGFAQSQPAPGTPPTVQLNADTAVSHGLTDKYTNDDFNVALGQCVAPGSASTSAPKSTTFSSPVLTFANYTFEPMMGVAANVSANAKLNPGTGAGAYSLTMTCNGMSYAATFTVATPAGHQVRRVPAGAAGAGDGSTAE
jgi:hypothetical protein